MKHWILNNAFVHVVAIAATLFVLMGFVDSVVRSYEMDMTEASAFLVTPQK